MAFVKLPAVYLDAVVMDAAASGIVLINRDPEQDEVGALINTNIAVDIADLTALGIDLSTVDVFVNGTLAYDGGTDTFQTGFDGIGSQRTAPDADTVRILIDPTSNFASLEVVTVRVVADTAGGGNAIDESYTFTVQDLTAPIVVAAEAKELKVVRISFDEAVKQVLAANGDDALNPANYVFAPIDLPAVTPVAVSVKTVTTSSVDITVDIDISPGRQYSVTVNNVEDLFGNPTESPTNVALFIGLIPPQPLLRNWDIIRFLPLINREEDATGDLKKFFDCLQEVTDLLLFDIDTFTDIIDPGIAEEKFLDAMLCDLGNPFSFEDLSEIDKRRLIDVLVAIYKEKGTAVGIINAVRFFLGIEVTIDEFNASTGWILGESELGIDTGLAPSIQFQLYSFNIISPVTLTADQRSRITFIAEFMKPAHTHLIDIVDPVDLFVDDWELGLSELGVTTDLHE